MGNVIGFICMLCFLGYVAKAAISALTSLWFYGVLAIGFLSLLVFFTHH